MIQFPVSLNQSLSDPEILIRLGEDAQRVQLQGLRACRCESFACAHSCVCVYICDVCAYCVCMYTYCHLSTIILDVHLSFMRLGILATSFHIAA